MSVAPAEAGGLTAPEARALTDRIRQTLSTGFELMQQAWQGRAWTALGYVSWEAYCAGEFAEARMVRLDREQRREIVAEMRQAGMSTRAIASGLGVPQTAVSRDVRSASESSDSDVPATVTSLDGRQRPATRPAPSPMGDTEQVDTATGEITEGDDVVRAPETGGVRTSHTPTTDPQDRRDPYDGTARAIGLDLGRIVARLDKLTEDDRTGRNADSIRQHITFEAGHTIAALVRLIDATGADCLPVREEARARWAADLFTAADACQRLGHHLQEGQK